MFWYLIINYLSEKKKLPNWMLRVSSKLSCSKEKQKMLDLEQTKNEKDSEIKEDEIEEKNEDKVEKEKKLKEKVFNNAIVLLRLLFFVLIFICMLVSYLYIWIDISS